MSQQDEPKGPSGALIGGLAWQVVGGHGGAGTMFLRVGEGITYVGREGFAAVLTTFLWGIFYPEPLLIYYAEFLFGLTILKRLKALWDRKFGLRQHSLTGGTSLFSVFLPFVGERLAKNFLEPAFIAWVGFMLLDYSRGVGVFSLACAAATFTRTTIEMAMVAANDMAEEDARTLMLIKAERERNKRWK